MGYEKSLEKEINIFEIMCLRNLVGVCRMDIQLGMKRCVGELE